MANFAFNFSDNGVEKTLAEMLNKRLIALDGFSVGIVNLQFFSTDGLTARIWEMIADSVLAHLKNQQNHLVLGLNPSEAALGKFGRDYLNLVYLENRPLRMIPDQLIRDCKGKLVQNPEYREV